jgi:hypothetical protein
LWTLEQGLGEDFTQEAKEAWTSVYLLLAEVMKGALANGLYRKIARFIFLMEKESGYNRAKIKRKRSLSVVPVQSPGSPTSG